MLIVVCGLWVDGCFWFVVCCVLFVGFPSLLGACWLLFVVCCVLCDVCVFVVCVVCCLFHVVRCVLCLDCRGLFVECVVGGCFC